MTAPPAYQDGIRSIGTDDHSYPPLLKNIHRPPAALFVRGEIPAGMPMVAIVGTRRSTDYGRIVTERFVADLAAAGVCIVSGLAYGIDGIAHTAALAAGGKTVAVLGTGIDRAHVTPRAHAALADDIVAAGGAIISEYPPGFEATAYSFPARNRIIAGLCPGTVVIEAPAASGALITARAALDENREVFAVPQNIFSDTSVGTNTLIKMGAHPVTSVQDILDVLNIQKPLLNVRSQTCLTDGQVSDVVLSPLETAIFSFLGTEPVHIDAVAKQAELPSNVVSGALTIMEIGGTVRNLGGMMYVRAR